MEGDVERLREQIIAWATSRPSANAGIFGTLGDDATKQQAAPVVLDAAVAMLLGDHLPEEARRVLIAPWRSIRPA